MVPRPRGRGVVGPDVSLRRFMSVWKLGLIFMAWGVSWPHPEEPRLHQNWRSCRRWPMQWRKSPGGHSESVEDGEI